MGWIAAMMTAALRDAHPGPAPPCGAWSGVPTTAIVNDIVGNRNYRLVFHAPLISGSLITRQKSGRALDGGVEENSNIVLIAVQSSEKT